MAVQGVHRDLKTPCTSWKPLDCPPLPSWESKTIYNQRLDRQQDSNYKHGKARKKTTPELSEAKKL